MQTSAPTDRAKDLEIQKLRADVAELVALLKDLDSSDATNRLIGRQWDRVRALIAKHGGQ